MFREFDIGCQEGDLIEFPGLTFQVLEVPGHTLDHIAYFVSPNRCSAQHIPWLFCGDTLFSAGCGRISNGTPEQLHRSLCRLAALPEPTALFCTHEYTLDNIEFALEFMPENTDLLAYREQCRRLRADSLPTLPSSIGCERRINPFFNLDRPDLVSVLARCDGLAPSDDAVQTFTRLRRQRDLFNHRLSQRHRGTSPEDGR
jgi:hydroxyacylglutathione hydrolase